MNFVITSEVRVYRLASRVCRAYLAVHHNACDLYFVNAKAKIVCIQRPSVGKRLVGDVYFFCICNKQHCGVCAVVDCYALGFMQRSGIFRPKNTVWRLAL